MEAIIWTYASFSLLLLSTCVTLPRSQRSTLKRHYGIRDRPPNASSSIRLDVVKRAARRAAIVSHRGNTISLDSLHRAGRPLLRRQVLTPIRKALLSLHSYNQCNCSTYYANNNSVRLTDSGLSRVSELDFRL